MDSNMTLKLNVVCALARYCKEHASFNPKAQIPLGVLLKNENVMDDTITSSYHTILWMSFANMFQDKKPSDE